MMRVFCTHCDSEKEYYIKNITKTFNVKGVNVKTTIKEAYCVDCNKKLFVYEVEKDNQRKVYDEYKKKQGLLTSFEIIQIREKYGLSQRQLAKIIRCGEKNIARYENGAIQDQTINLLIMMVDMYPEFFGLVEIKKDTTVIVVDLKTTYEENESLYKKNRQNLLKGGLVAQC